MKPESGLSLSSRTATAVLFAVVTLAISVVLAVYFDFFFVFLLVPFVPLLFRDDEPRRVRVRECPACGFRTRDESYEYCPRDGEQLRVREYQE